MGLSAVAMVAAAFGLLAPTGGALLQEGIDVLAIGIALTGLLPTAVHTVTMSAEDTAVAIRLREEHGVLRALVEDVRAVADGLSDDADDVGAVHLLVQRLQQELVPHEQEEELLLLPVVARALGGPDPTGGLSRTHAEIGHQVARLNRIVDDVGTGPVTEDDVVELRRALYGLYGVLRLHNAQEEESAFSLIPDAAH
jgi:hypothetical protein